MKVLDLQCQERHEFEGWFGSEHDFQQQLESGLLTCPVCNSSSVSKKPSAPRLNLLPAKADTPRSESNALALAPTPQAQAQLLQALRQMVSESEDVGDNFVSEARKMHAGAAPERSIRGQATPAQALELLEDGIPVLPLPGLLKEPLH